MIITTQHRLEKLHITDSGIVSWPLPASTAMRTRRCLVIHFTEGATATSSLEHMKRQGTSAHLTIDRDGTIYQSVPFDRQAAHAGRSQWRDPKTGQRYEFLNQCAIGIELANAGRDPGALKWAKTVAKSATVKAIHRNEKKMSEWEVYPEAQMRALEAVTRLLVERYRLDDITGHDCISPDRKVDPGPAFPMREFREKFGFAGLPQVLWK